MVITNHGVTLRLRQTTSNDSTILWQYAYSNTDFMHSYCSNNPFSSEEELKNALIEREKYTPSELGYMEFLIENFEEYPLGIIALADYSNVHSRAELLIGMFNYEQSYNRNALEAMLLIFELAFNQYNVNKLYTYVYDYNKISEASTINLGFIQEGLLEDHHYVTSENKFVSLYVNGLTQKNFRVNDKIRRLSIKVLKRDITRSSLTITDLKPEEDIDIELFLQHISQLNQ